MYKWNQSRILNHYKQKISELQTLRKRGHNHKSGPGCHTFWDVLCNQTALHSLWSIFHRPIACDCCASSWNASLSQQGHPRHDMGHGASKLAQDTQTLSSSPLVSPSSVASMAPCASSYASEGSGPSGIPGCRSHTHNDLIPARFWVRGTLLLHLDLQRLIHNIINIYI